MAWESSVGSGPGLTPRINGAMALAGGGARDGGSRLGAELFTLATAVDGGGRATPGSSSPNAKALIGSNTEFHKQRGSDICALTGLNRKKEPRHA